MKSIFPARRPENPERVVHVWSVELDARTPSLEAAASLIDEQELERASRFRFDDDRRRYVRAHAALRSILASYLGSDRSPAALHFTHGPHGKPALAAASNGALHFNLAHSAEVACIAVTRAGEVGVDVERLHEVPEALDLAESFFSEYERKRLLDVPPEGRNTAFLECWTRKEAFIKALGEGLSHPLNEFDVVVEPGEPPRILRIAGVPDEALDWSMHALAPAPGYVGAVVVARSGIPLVSLAM